ncbi:MAG: hypothetical protein GQ534_01860 [Candidatus Delongbacteria bacterium]|nr:hypothetical protein [Candidatus Delongbacteria bacterium]
MKKIALLLIVILSVSFLGCGGKSTEKETIKAKGNSTAEVKTVEKKENKIPEGYPEELIFPAVITVRVTSGTGSSSGMGGDRTFKSYYTSKRTPKNVPEIISHYKKLMTDLGYEGKWKVNDEDKIRGIFKKGLNELELKISSEDFSFYLKIWDAEVVK